MKRKLSLLVAVACICTLHAQQYVDRVLLGNEENERLHGYTTYCPDYVAVQTDGLMGESGRYCRQYRDNPYSGIYKGINGGEYQFVLKVDGTQQNYLTVRYSGNDTGNECRYTADVDNKVLQDIAASLIVYSSDSKSPGTFLYCTYAIPRKETDKKKEVVIRIRSKGRYYSYGTPWEFATYQRVLESYLPPIYACYTHVNPSFEVPSDEKQGRVKAYEDAPAKKNETQLSKVRATAVEKLNEQIRKLLSGSDFIPSDPNNYYNYVALMGVAYHTSTLEAYHNPQIAEKIKRVIDQMVVHRNKGTQTVGDSWGGAFGNQAYALYLIKETLTDAYLDESPDLGRGTSKTRRQQWIEVFKESFDCGAKNRKNITNQVNEATYSTYGAALGLYALDSATYAHFPEISHRLAREAAGLEDFTGALHSTAAPNPQLGNPATSISGPNYRMVTDKGTGREEGWTCAGGYGNFGPRILELWEMTSHDPDLSASKGDPEILQMAALHERTQSTLSYPWTDPQGCRAMMAESVICCRNVYEPGRIYYGNIMVGAMASDSLLLGHYRQMYQDGQHDWASPDTRRVFALFIPQAIDSLLAHPECTDPLLATPGRGDFQTTDEQNGILGFRYGNELVYINFLNAKAQHITPNETKSIEFEPDRTVFFPSGLISTTKTEPYNEMHRVYFPDRPQLAGGGIPVALPSYSHTTGVYNPKRTLCDFYQLRYNKFLIGMNTGIFDQTVYFLEIPIELQGKTVRNLSTGENITLGNSLPVPTHTTYVLYVGEASTIGKALPKNEIGNGGLLLARVNELTAFAQAHADSVILADQKVIDMFPHTAFTDFMRELTFANYAANCGSLSQHRIDSALFKLNEAYEKLRSSQFKGEYSMMPGKIDFFKQLDKGGNFSLVSTDSILKSAYSSTFLVLPVRTTKEGYYTLTAKIASMSPQNAFPRVNITLFDEKEYYVDSSAVVEQTHYLRINKDWTDYQDYSWKIYLKAGEKKLLKLSLQADAHIRTAQIASLTAELSEVTAYIQCGTATALATDSARVPQGTQVKMRTVPLTSAEGGTFQWSEGSNGAELIISDLQESCSYSCTYTSPQEYVSTIIYKIKVYEKNRLAEGDYYILNATNGKYYTNPCSVYSKDDSEPSLFAPLSQKDPDTQIWELIIDPRSNRYKITSKKDERFLNEHGVIRNRQYEASWNTYEIYKETGSALCAIQNGGNSSTGFWFIENDHILTSQSGFTSIPSQSSFAFIPAGSPDALYSPTPEQKAKAWTDEARTVLYVLTSKKASLHLTDIKGSLHKEYVCEEGINCYPIANLPNGIYLGTLHLPTGNVSFKMIR